MAAGRGRSAGLLVLAVLLAACAGDGTTGAAPRSPSPSPSSSALPTPSPTPSATGRQDDLDRLERLFATRHAAEIDLGDDIAALRPTVGSMSDEEFLLEVMRLAAGRERDGHTGVFPTAQPQLELWPLQLYDFEDGWRVVHATEDHEDLIGREVTAIGGRPVAEVAELVAPLVPRDNGASLRGRLPLYLVVPDVLEGLGLDASLELDGEQYAPQPVGSEEYADEFGLFYPLVCPPLPRSGPLWSLEERDDAVVLAFHRVVFDSDGQTTQELAEELLAAVERVDAARVVFDLRDNPGGELPAARPLVEAFQQIGAERPGALRLLVNRCTFSAASLTASDLLATTDAVLVGEPMGGAPWIWADARPHALVASGIIIHVATRPYEAGTSGMPVLIGPDVSVPVTWADWSAELDPTLEAAAQP